LYEHNRDITSKRRTPTRLCWRHDVGCVKTTLFGCWSVVTLCYLTSRTSWQKTGGIWKKLIWFSVSSSP